MSILSNTVRSQTLQTGLEQLVAAELLYQRGRPPRAKYIFKHALIQDVAYQSLLRRTRQKIHEHVAQLLEASFPDIVEMQPELVAHQSLYGGGLCRPGSGLLAKSGAASQRAFGKSGGYQSSLQGA